MIRAMVLPSNSKIYGSFRLGLAFEPFAAQFGGASGTLVDARWH